GPTPYGCNNIQDNLSIIISQNGFGYRADDYSNDININPQMFSIAGNTVSGIISTNTDKDAFNFSLAQNAIIHMDIKPFSVNVNDQGANLDIKMSLYNSARELIKTFDPANSMSVVVDTVLNAGEYYMLIDGAGNSNVTNYGSLGSYSISSSTGTVLAVNNILLAGKPDKKLHSLNWKINADEPVKLTEVQSSAGGVHFKTVASFSNATSSFSYRPAETEDLYYRIKVISLQNQTYYSNTIKLKSSPSNNIFTVSTFIQNEITVASTQKYQYLLSDINGRAIARGNAQVGTNKVNMSNMPGGIYVLHLVSSNNDQQTERIIKQ
ncbi:MAG: T9SS type A sorting domain-containing protein, partial [Aquabacterium sp.]|nr:T9SS type A sorting domain-containing protein [Ferruginibacter sp.]